MNEFLFGEAGSWEKRARRQTEAHQGVTHAWRIDPPVVGPGESPILTVWIEVDQPVERVTCSLYEPARQDIHLERAATRWDQLNWSYSQVWKGSLPPQPEGRLVRYRIFAHQGDGGEPIPADGGAVFSYLVGDPAPPAWSREAVIYQIFPDRFHPGPQQGWRTPDSIDGIYGGTLSGILLKLDYIADLGFNCMWLNPIFPDDTHHGYQARDYFQVNPRLGTMEEARRLVEEAHGRGIRLLLDFAANHWSCEHPTFQSALSSKDSEYYGWYRWIEWPERYETYYGIKKLPKLNVDHPGMRAHLLEAAAFWLEEIGFDGFRLDHAHGVSLDFWTEFRRSIKALKPDAWIFGEVTDSPARLLEYSGRLDGCLDFLLAQALRDTFTHETRLPSGLDSFLANHERFFPGHFSRPSFLDNHDMNRFLFASGSDARRLKMAALCQFTLSGPPIVYYGTEVGVGQARGVSGPGSLGLAEARQPMLWGEEQDRDLHQFYRGLVHLRREHPALAGGTRRTVHLDDSAGTYAYARSGQDEEITVCFNLSDRHQSVSCSGHTFDLPPWSGDIHIQPAV